MRRRRRAGSALLEVIAALTLLVISAVAGASLLAHLFHTVAAAERTDRDTAAAAAVIARVSLWPRARLEQALGEHPSGDFIVSVQRLTPTLYKVDVASMLRRVSALSSVFYRREEVSAPNS